MSYNPVLVHKTRGKRIESFHRGSICIVDEKSRPIFVSGDVDEPVFSRSALKLFQHIPLVESGAAEALKLTQQEVAVVCGSHNAEKTHLEAVRSILKKAGLTEKQLKCGSQYPFLKEDKLAFYRSGKTPGDIYNNCSGKHAGFLALSVYLGHPVEGYLDPEHPVQKLILESVSKIHEYPVENMDVAIDGCSAPIYSIPLINQAMAVKNLLVLSRTTTKTGKACKFILDSIIKYPEMIAGQKRYCTDLMKANPGKVIGKTGAEGVFALGFPELQAGCAIKIDDGCMGPQYAVAQKIVSLILEENHEQNASLKHYMYHPIKNWNKYETGIYKTNHNAFKALEKYLNL